MNGTAKDKYLLKMITFVSPQDSENEISSSAYS